VADNDSRSVEDLKRDTERSRAEFTQTINQLRGTVSDAAADLRDRLAPETIKADIGDYVRTRGERMMEAAQQNPLQAAAVGAIAAYPVAALMRRIPMPIMMIGAGLFLMSSQTGRNLSQQATERAGDLAEQGRQMASDLRDRSSDALAGVAEQASSVKASIHGAVSDASDALRRSASEMRSDMADSTAQATGTARHFADKAQQTASDAMDSLRNPGASFESLTRWASENPLLAAAAAMAVGGFVASALPVTRLETRIAETATGDLRRRLGDAAAQGVSAVDQITERASQEGLTPQAIADAARDFGERALKIAEAAAGAALANAHGHDDSHIPAGG
jgi:hypothetical protein